MKLMEAAKRLHESDTVGVIPTDTIYGLVARAADQAAVKKLYKLKNRDDKPGTIIAADIGQLEELGLKHRYLKAVEQFWPGAISVVIPCSDPDLKYLHRGKLSLATRIPDDKPLVELLRKTGPLLTTSANHPGQAPAHTVTEARKCFGEAVNFYVDGGDFSKHEPSTIIRIVDDAVEVLRHGAVKMDGAGRRIA